jgi:hypothetical protein
MTITVTEEDRDRGIRHNHQCCMIAQTLLRKFPGAHVSVGYHQALVNETVYEMDMAGRDLAMKFDSGATLTLPTDVSMREMN